MNNQTTVMPIFICSDDQDYSFTTVVVEISRENSKIKWLRFSINANYEHHKYETIGECVNWFQWNNHFEFYYSEYRKVIDALKSGRIL